MDSSGSGYGPVTGSCEHGMNIQVPFKMENPMLGMLITSCIKGLGPFRQNSYAQCAV
jgi:hypothetical protein